MIQKKPAIPITSKYFKYTPSYETDIRKTFEELKNPKNEGEDEHFFELLEQFIPPLPPGETT